MTQATEESEVGQGLAAALIDRGVAAVTARRLTLQLAFIHAWRAWPHSATYRHIRADYDRNSIETIIRRSERRRGAPLAAWLCGQWMEPYLREGVDLEDARILVPRYSNIAWDEWLALADLFAAEFEASDLVRERPCEAGG